MFVLEWFVKNSLINQSAEFYCCQNLYFDFFPNEKRLRWNFVKVSVAQSTRLRTYINTAVVSEKRYHLVSIFQVIIISLVLIYYL